MDAKLVHITSVGGDVYVIRPFHLPASPGQGLPEPPAIPGVPDNTLPTTPPPQVAPGQTLVIVRTADGKWHWATVASPPVVLPEPMPTPPMAPGMQPQPKS